MTDQNPKCLVCERNIDDIPLIPLEYQTSRLHICPEHLPILIHHPEQLVGKLPGVEKLQPHEH